MRVVQFLKGAVELDLIAVAIHRIEMALAVKIMESALEAWMRASMYVL